MLSKDNYYDILDISAKELAANIVLKNYLMSKTIDHNENLLRDFYDINNDDFIFLEDAFVVNMAVLSDETEAIEFRNSVLQKGWKESVEMFSNDQSMLDIKIQNTLKRSQIQSKKLIRALDKLYNGEVTLVLRTELNNFVIVQQIEKIPKYTIPKYKYVKEEVLKSFTRFKQKELARKYIDSLMTQKNVKIY